jgi:outer membrane lipoprotein-sorting protein
MNRVEGKPAAGIRNRRSTIIFLLASGFALLASSLQAQSTYTLDQVFAKMDQVAKTFRSVEADLERTHVTILVNDKDIASGKFYYSRRAQEPRVKMELTKPVAEYLLIDKGKLQLFRPKQKQVQEGSLGANKDKVEMFMALGFGPSSQELTKNYDVTLGGEELVDGKKAIVLDLKPKNSRMGIKSFRLWMDQEKWVSVQLRATEPSGDYFVLKYSNLKVNTNIPDSVFDLKLPKDVQVIKM